MSAVRCVLLASTLLFVTVVATAANILENRMSTDTTPIDLSVGSKNYRIPRNFLYTMDKWSGGPQELVSLRVEYPGFRPFSEQNKPCFLRKLKCRLIEFRIALPQFVSTDEGIENIKAGFPKPERDIGPFGFELYKVGPDNLHTEYYRKIRDGHPIAFSCLTSDGEKPQGVCSSKTRIRSGGVIHYFFSRREIEDAEDINIGLRNLVESFSIEAPR